MRLEKEYKKSGYFWLPEQQEKKIAGTLVIHDGGKIELETVDSFDKSYTESFDLDNIPRIIGNVESDGYVTLDDCFYIEKNVLFGGIGKSKIIVNKVYKGVAYDKDEEVTFNTLLFSVDCLDEWIGISGFTNKYYPDLKTSKVSYTQPENIYLQLDNGMELEICFSAKFPLGSKVSKIEIVQTVSFKLKSEILRPLNDFTELMYKLTNFMCFAIDDIVSIKDVSATTVELQKKVGKEKQHPISIYIYFESRPYSTKIPKKSWHNMLFTFGIIKDNAQDIFNNWLNAYEVISPAIGLYFSTQIDGYKFLEGKFLALAQGLETYHRRTSNEKLMDENDFKLLIKNIIKNSPEKHKEWLEKRLKYGNEISLAKRLQQIIEPFKAKFGNHDNRKMIIRKIVDTRNYFTHYDEDLKDQAVTKGNKLYVLCEIMEVTFQLHFLKVIGFSDKEIDNVIENNYLFKQKLEDLKL